MICDICNEPIADGEKHYEMPDGMTVCFESDCLKEWADAYLVH